MRKARFPPLSGRKLIRRKARPMRIQTTIGPIDLEAIHGWDRDRNEWVMPARLDLGMAPHQRMSPVLAERIAVTALRTGSYEKAAEVARVWGAPADDSTIHRQLQVTGQKAIEQIECRVAQVFEPASEPTERKVERPKSPNKAAPFSLIVMMDGWMIRERGKEWGLKPPEKQASRVEWREVKSAVLFRVEDQVRKESGRGMLVKKFMVTWRGDPIEFGRRLYAEAFRRGLEQAGKLFVVADGGVWIWNLAAEHFPQAQGVLDFYHAAEHLHAVAHAIHEDPAKARAWAQPLAHQLKHGSEAGVLRTLEDLIELAQGLDEEKAETVRREVKYFQSHREHLHYKNVKAQNCPIGSGAMESGCAQLQERFKGPGKFWSEPGHARLMALETARRNDDWSPLYDS
jgi:hypothetical protein